MKIKVAPGNEKGVGMGPVIDVASKDRILSYIKFGEEDGAKLVLDGRKIDDFRLSIDDSKSSSHSGNRQSSIDNRQSPGCFIGPTIFDNVRPGMRIAEDEIFGPVLSVMREQTLDAAIATMNRSRYGNMAVIFTSSGYDATRFPDEQAARRDVPG